MRKRTKRKVWGLINPISMAVEGAAVSEGSQVERLRMGELSALESFRIGKAVESDWHLLSVMTSISALMAYEMKTPEPLAAARRAQKALDSIEERFKRTGRWGTSGEELNALREMYEYHDAQRTGVARSVYESAIFRSKGVLQDPVRRQKVLYGKEKP